MYNLIFKKLLSRTFLFLRPNVKLKSNRASDLSWEKKKSSYESTHHQRHVEKRESKKKNNFVALSLLSASDGAHRRCIGALGRGLAGLGDALLLLSRLEDLERAHQRVVHAHHGTRVVELTTVVGRAEDGDQLALGEEFVTVLDDLVSAADEVQVMSAQELGHHVLAKGKGHTAVVLSPAHDVLVGVGPQQVAQQTRVGNI